MKRLILFALGLTACQSLPQRGPSSIQDPQLSDQVSSLYLRTLGNQLVQNDQETLERKYPGLMTADSFGARDHDPESAAREEAQARWRQLDQIRRTNASEIREITGEIQSRPEALPQGGSLQVTGNLSSVWRDQAEALIIDDLKDYALDARGKIQRNYVMDRSGAKTYQLKIENYVFSHDPRLREQNQKSSPALSTSLTCNGPFRLKKTFFNREYKAGQVVKFRLFDNGLNGENVRLMPDPRTTHCEYRFRKEDETGRVYGVNIINDQGDPFASLHSFVDGCFLPGNDHLQGVQKFFLTSHFNSMTCAERGVKITTLEDPVTGFRSKVEALLGQPIPESVVKAGNPFVPLDFSKAPHFDDIYVSYLVFRADFYGNMIARLLQWHADHGTRVRIMVSSVIELDKDRRMLWKLAQGHNNIKLQEYKYAFPEGGNLTDKFNQLHRTLHVKLLIGLSRSNPAADFAYIGGRNIHDGFIFKDLPDHRAFPQMVQYGDGGDESYVHWRDFEIKVQSPEFAERVAAHLLTFWDRDARSMLARSINQNVVLRGEADASYFRGSDEDPLVRHFVSFPYKDSHSLEEFYVEMIDSARKDIRISTPYFRPTDKISAALERAVRRGVQITLITRLDLKGDTVDWLLSDANKASVNKFWEDIKIYEYTEPGVILHSKIVLIDHQFSFLGSVNLNKRSFYHDLENGIMVYSPAFARHMEDIYAVYRRDSRLITSDQKTSFIKSIILHMFDTEF